MSIEKAIRILLRTYEQVKEDKHIYNPVAYALYQTWKQADEEGAKHEAD